MEGRTFPLAGHDAADEDIPPRLPERPQQLAPEPAPGLPPRRPWEAGPTSDLPGGSMHEEPLQSTIRAVTPEPADTRHFVSDADISQPSRGLKSHSAQSSPRSITAARAAALAMNDEGLSAARRQGVVFRDDVGNSLDSSSGSPPQKPASLRPRTHTLDGLRQSQQLSPAAEHRHRVGSFSSATSLTRTTIEDQRVPLVHTRVDLPTASPASQKRTPELQTSPAINPKEKKTTSRSRLVKRVSSRPNSPMVAPPPSVDSLPLPIPTSDPNKILLLMKTLCGRMRGELEYRRESTGPWYRGVCYVDEEKGSLMFESGDLGPFHMPIVADLRGCRISPVDQGDISSGCLEIFNNQLGIEIHLRPLIAEDFDLWLAALLCWQQLQPSGVKTSNGRGSTQNLARADIKRRASSSGLKDAAIIKVGKVMLWDKGVAASPRALVKRPSTRDLRASQGDWKRVSCILQDNGEFKLMTENDVTVLSIIELSQLARCAIQQLDKSVLDEEFCIGIFPIYSTAATRLSILRPLYVSLDSRVLFEVWFVLLRAFTLPPIYELIRTGTGEVLEVADYSVESTTNHFRVEKTVTVRVTEAKLRSTKLAPESGSYDRSAKVDQAGLVANYLAEVILDGEVRARTIIKTETKNPFWREDCEFTDLPSTVPFLSVLLKRVDGNLENLKEQLHTSVGLSKSGTLVEVPCGNVDIPLHQMERGKDHEQWHTIYDDKQQSIGTMLIKVHHEELVVLSSKEYQPLSELLHRFSTGLTAQVSEAVHGNSRRLAEVFLNIFQVSGTATEWLMNLVEDEIDGIGNQAAIKKPRFSRRLRSNESIESTSDREQIVRDMGKSLAGEVNLLFRGNSLLTQALEFHMRRLGKEYLEEILSDKIHEINEANANCEVDPSKLSHGQDIQKNWAQLMRLITEIWDCIAPSANRIPQELRHILKYIRAVAEDRYGDFLRTVTYTSVSGFLFLRFICPAILNPKLFGLLRDHPRPRAQRTLTLIAKCLQALANLSTIGKKETWTQPMNHFINTQRQPLKDFIDGVCAIPMERNPITVPASYSTPITILGRLAPLSREGFPSLPYLIDHARNFAMLVKLWTDANPAAASEVSDAVAPGGSSTRVFDGDLLDFHSLCTAIQRRADERHAYIENLRLLRLAAATGEDEVKIADPAANQVPTAEADRLGELADVFDRSSLLDVGPASSFGSSTAVWTDAELAAGSSSTLRPPGSSGSDIESSGFSAAAFRDAGRNGAKEGSRHVSGSSEWHLGGSPASTMRGLKNGKHARKLLSGFMRKGRASSPDVAAGSRAPLREEGNEGERHHDRDRQAERGPGKDMSGRKYWH
ncbi:hypothetical protein GE09DRAFT_1168514 [Coniochaeta sp. 2T2.1]|nr:hypothetical protein GE09DRAFT_1168514 [Coniochaeta sp. 2T2.1]